MNIHTGNIDEYVKGSLYTGNRFMSDENVVGSFFGKPLYEQMFEVINLNKNESTVIRGIPTNHHVVSIDAIYTDEDNNTYFPLSYFDSTTEFNVYISDSKLTYLLKSPRDITDLKVYIRYYIEDEE